MILCNRFASVSYHFWGLLAPPGDQVVFSSTIKDTIRDGGGIALQTADTVDTVYTVDTVDLVYTVNMVCTVNTVDTVCVYTIETALRC